MAEIFISYTRGAEPDEKLVDFFTSYLRNYGHNVFVDKEIPIGSEWPNFTYQRLRDADYFVVLISADSVRSEMVIEEVRTAYRRLNESRPLTILPVRIDYELDLPYDLGAYLNRIQYVLWKSDADTLKIAEKMILSIEQNHFFGGDLCLPSFKNQMTIVDDGNALQLDKAIAPPRPSVDYHSLTELVAPGGAVELPSSLYIERAADRLVRTELLKQGWTLCIKGGRQTGKSSLLARADAFAKSIGYSVIYVNVELIDKSYKSDLDTLLHYLANFIAKELRVKPPSKTYWKSNLPPKIKLTDFLESILETRSTPIVLTMDGVDLLFHFSYRNDFFSLIRAWHDMRARNELFKMLNISLAYSTESFLFIDDVISPFNIGTRVELTDFSLNQLKELNIRHNTPIGSAAELQVLYNLTGGHPYLARKALYELIIYGWTVTDLEKVALNDAGPFADHLRWYRWYLHKEVELKSAFKDILAGHPCTDVQIFYRLRSAGLVQGQDGQSAVPRCDLYARYFTRYL